jgi:hypothetical protein
MHRTHQIPHLAAAGFPGSWRVHVAVDHLFGVDVQDDPR